MNVIRAIRERTMENVCNKNETIRREPSISELQSREKYHIDIQRHIKHFDKTGESIGCGCPLCGLYHKIEKLKQKLTHQEALICFLEEVIKRKKKNFVFESVSYTAFFPQSEFKGHFLLNKDVKYLSDLKDKTIKKIKKIEKDLKFDKETLSRLCFLTGISIVKHSKTKMIRLKKQLSDIDDLNDLTLEKCIKLAKSIDIYRIDEKQIKNLKANANKRTKRYINLLLRVGNKTLCVPGFKVKENVDKKDSMLDMRIDVNTIKYESLHKKSKDKLNNIQTSLVNLLKKYQDVGLNLDNEEI